MNYLETYSETFKDSNYASLGYADPKHNYIFDSIKRNNVKTIIDIGSGRGCLMKQIKEMFPDIEILSADLDKFNDVDVKFIKMDLSIKNDRDELKQNHENNKYDLVTCLDVLEHLDKSFIEDVIKLYSIISKRCILTIANHSDIWNGVELHTIQEDFGYWGPLLLRYFNIVHYQEMYIDNGKPRLYLVELISK